MQLDESGNVYLVIAKCGLTDSENEFFPLVVYKENGAWNEFNLGDHSIAIDGDLSGCHGGDLYNPRAAFVGDGVLFFVNGNYVKRNGGEELRADSERAASVVVNLAEICTASDAEWIGMQRNHQDPSTVFFTRDSMLGPEMCFLYVPDSEEYTVSCGACIVRSDQLLSLRDIAIANADSHL